jgi:hypothetical protein
LSLLGVEEMTLPWNYIVKDGASMILYFLRYKLIPCICTNWDLATNYTPLLGFAFSVL